MKFKNTKIENFGFGMVEYFSPSPPQKKQKKFLCKINMGVWFQPPTNSSASSSQRPNVIYIEQNPGKCLKYKKDGLQKITNVLMKSFKLLFKEN